MTVGEEISVNDVFNMFKVVTTVAIDRSKRKLKIKVQREG